MTSKRKISDPSGQPSTKKSKFKAGDSDLETEKVTSVWSFSEEQDESTISDERKKTFQKDKEVFIEKSIELEK